MPHFAHRRLKLLGLGIESVGERVTPHSLRRRYASVRAAPGDGPAYIAEQLDHTDPRFTLSVYTKAVERRAKLSAVYLAEYERALAWVALPSDWAAMDSKAPTPPVNRASYPPIWLR